MYLHNVPRPAPDGEGADAAAAPAAELAESVEFQHKPGQRYYNFEEVKAEIMKEMDRGAGRNKGISPEPICLTIHSARVPDLVIIDLPGITKVPVGDQPADIEVQIRRLCLHYLSQPNNIILAVTPANQDLTNSDALKLALEADPEGERTIGVLTKVDLMDPGTDARDVLSGRVISLRRGFVPVVARSQRDIAEGMPISTGLSRERAFFARHYAYKGMAARCGSNYLTRVLSHMLFTAIRAHLPSLRSQLSLAVQAHEAQLRSLGDPVDAASPKEQGHLLLKLLARFAANFCDMIEGRVHADAGGDLLIDELFGGARMQEIVRTRFNQWTAEWETLMDTQLRDEEILMALRNSAGPRSALFIPEQAFVSLVRRQIVQLKDLGRRFADEIYDELRRIAEKCEPPGLYRFGELREKAVEVVQVVLRRAFVPTVDMIDRLIDIELAHINTQHPDFVGAARALALAEERGWLDGGGAEGGGAGGGAGGDAGGGAEAGGDPHAPGGEHLPSDVAWALKRMGVAPAPAGGLPPPPPLPGGAAARGGGGGAFAGLGGGLLQNLFGRRGGDAGGGGGSSAAVAAALATTLPRSPAPTVGGRGDDVRARFGARVSDAMQGGDDAFGWALGGGGGGVRRVGGPNSPYVGVPRASPHRGLGARAPAFSDTLPFFGGARGAGARGGSPLAAALAGAAARAQPAQQQQQQQPAYQGEALLVIPQRPLPETITPGDLRADEKETREICLLRILLNSYLHIVKKNYTDLVPKTVMCMLVNRVKEEIASDLVHNLYAQITSLDALLRETDDIAARRKELTDQISTLTAGLSILNEIRDAGILAAPPTGPGAPPGAAAATAAAAISGEVGAVARGFERGWGGESASGGGGNGGAGSPEGARSLAPPAGSSPGDGGGASGGGSAGKDGGGAPPPRKAPLQQPQQRVPGLGSRRGQEEGPSNAPPRLASGV